MPSVALLTAPSTSAPLTAQTSPLDPSLAGPPGPADTPAAYAAPLLALRERDPIAASGACDRPSDPTLRLYAILRADLAMSPGKATAQAGHAYLDSFLVAQAADPERASEYRGAAHGTKIALLARDEAAVLRALAAAEAAGLPCVLIVDQGHVMPGTAFDGAPIVTALGIGPVRRAEVRHITKRFALVP